LDEACPAQVATGKDQSRFSIRTKSANGSKVRTIPAFFRKMQAFSTK